MPLINFTTEELFKIESCILGDGDSYGDSVFESILDKIENCPDLYTTIEVTNYWLLKKKLKSMLMITLIVLDSFLVM